MGNNSLRKTVGCVVSILFCLISAYVVFCVIKAKNSVLDYEKNIDQKRIILAKHDVETDNIEENPIEESLINKNTNKLTVSNNAINNLKLAVGTSLNKEMSSVDIFNYVVERIKVSYVEDIEDKTIYENALKGILSSLDPHSGYLNDKEYKEMQIQTKGEFGGLGIVVSKDNNFIKIISPIDDTPAHRAGIQSGDYIAEIDGVDTFDMSLVSAVEKMRGKIGTKVKLVILRKGESKPLEFNLRRELIKAESVKGEIKKDNIIYLRISNFIETTQQDVISIINKLKMNIKNNNKNGSIKGVILDLRNNPGGLLDQSVKISELFLDGNKTVVSIRGKNNQFLEDFKTSNKKALISNVPIVVLVNEGSASASEIVAGALQDYKVAIVMGEKTFGKASVQQVFPLVNGGAIKITMARYYTPLGRSIQLDGIVPDIIVKKGTIVFNDKEHPEIREKDLKGHLQKQEINENEDIIQQTIKEKTKEKNNVDDLSENSNDYQLLKALDLINGVNFYNSKNE